MTPTAIWCGAFALAVSFVALAGALYGYRSEVRELREVLDGKDDNPGLLRKVTLLEGRLNQLANYVVDNERTATGPISLARPTPKTRPQPTTVPGIPSARPQVPHTGSTASSTPTVTGPRHRAPKKKAA